LIYIIDTNIISYMIRNNDQKLVDQLEWLSIKATMAVSSITVAELFYGVQKKQSKKLEIAVHNILLPLEKFSFDESAAVQYGKIRASLEVKGEIIGSNDLLIAAHAISLDATLVTNNEREFRRVEGLRVENWV
jgi:tRNA(fMet)-specific endonuclease VapC